ncbi:Vacuolar protein sorting-associated protein 9a [Tolypocladium paradoxum]|uniref:Vacuolar protein sorting-associated protein 9a n=1 Tax=Tolypocladium paradoxum TaxID=94208 RepID=A0A2S4L2B2_9HYPO|nr:Vacuolar protein sorting-associated protein 9a [Tolypocladium paradoxum]
MSMTSCLRILKMASREEPQVGDGAAPRATSATRNGSATALGARRPYVREVLRTARLYWPWLAGQEFRLVACSHQAPRVHGSAGCVETRRVGATSTARDIQGPPLRPRLTSMPFAIATAANTSPSTSAPLRSPIRVDEKPHVASTPRHLPSSSTTPPARTAPASRPTTTCMSPPEQPSGHEVTSPPGSETKLPTQTHAEVTPVQALAPAQAQPAAAGDAPVGGGKHRHKHHAAGRSAGQPPSMASAADTTGVGHGDHTEPDTPADTGADAASESLQPLPQAQDARDTPRPSTPVKGKHVAEPEPSDNMASSVATIKAPKPTPLNDTSPQYLTADPSSYVDPTPATPMTSQPPSRSPSNARSHRSADLSPSRSDEDKRCTSEDEQDGGSRSEIQSIMEQFSEAGGGPGEEEVMSPRLEIASPILGGSMQHPPRKSSLEPLAPSISSQLQEFNALRVSASSPSSVRSKDRFAEDQGPPVPPKDGAFGTPPRSKEDRKPSAVTSPTSAPLPIHRPPPPEPEPEPALPFDFHRFLEQLRNKKADPVARYLKSFLSEFGKRQWMVHEQVKIISDFLAFIANKMVQCEVWRDVSDAEFDNAREGMEKLVMNRLYTQTFSPAIAPPQPIPGAKPKRRGGDIPMGPGRRGQHQEDVERDDILTQKINIYGWVKEDHLDIPPVGESGRRFLKLAQQGWSHTCLAPKKRG